MALACHNLYRSYHTGTQSIEVLRGVNLRLSQQEVIAILGPSGSGKSTLLHLLAGLDKPDQGEIYWQDVPVHATPQNQLAQLRLKQLGLIFQHHYLLEDLTVTENITLSGRLQGRIDASRAHHLLTQVGLSERANFLPKKLSGGERQRVAVARALYNQPSLILADEPTGSLDRQSARNVYRLLVDLARQEHTAVVIVTHDEGLVEDVDRRYRLFDGLLKPL